MSINTSGCSIGRGDAASPETYPVISGVTDFTGPTGSRTVIDKTALADTTKQKEVGVADMGQVSFNAVYDGDETTHTGLFDDFQAGTLRNFRIIFDDSPQETFDFAAYVLQYSFNTGVDDVVRISVTLEISGAVTDNN